MGKLFAESEVLKRGNSNILDNLEEGVVILNDSNLSEILYQNSAARGVKRSQTSQFQTTNFIAPSPLKPNIAKMLK